MQALSEEKIPASGEITKLLVDWRQGEAGALQRLTPLIYEELIRLARARLKAEVRQCTLQPTALVHESYLRLAAEAKLSAENRTHFYAVASNIMRRVLVDYARKRRARKRGADLRVTLQTGMDIEDVRDPDSLSLDEALK
jgi:RNA polymerase sigma-70 factor, ECF subfamily